VTAGMNFSDVAQAYLRELQTGSNPCRPKTIAAYRSAINCHLTPRFGSTPLAELATQNNRVLKDLVKDLRVKYKPASIRLVVTLAKQVLESPKNENGLPLYPMQWSADFIDLPAIVNQKQPTVTREQVQSVVRDGPDATLYAFLAASGLRISEALNLRREDYADGTVHVRQGKTANAARYVDLAPEIAAMMDKVVGDTKPGARIFRTHLTTLRNRIRVPGFHSLRRFRSAVLRRSDCRDLLCDYWLGHRNVEMGSRYAKQLLEDVAFRKEWAERVGTGFIVPTHLYHEAAPQAVETVNLKGESTCHA
jgi:integrase